MGHLVDPDRDPLRLVHEDVRRLQQRISQEPVGGRFEPELLDHLLEGRHALKIRWSSACSGTSDWMNSVLRSGSSPAPSQSAAISIVLSGARPLFSGSVVRACQFATK